MSAPRERWWLLLLLLVASWREPDNEEQTCFKELDAPDQREESLRGSMPFSPLSFFPT